MAMLFRSLSMSNVVDVVVVVGTIVRLLASNYCRHQSLLHQGVGRCKFVVILCRECRVCRSSNAEILMTMSYEVCMVVNSSDDLGNENVEGKRRKDRKDYKKLCLSELEE